MRINSLEKKSIAHSDNASIINGQRLHISKDIVGEKNVIYDTISKTSSKTSARETSRRDVELLVLINKCII